MNNNNNNTSTCGISFFSALGLIFITLKLLGVISWSWLWVLSPFWLPATLVLVIGLFVILILHKW